MATNSVSERKYAMYWIVSDDDNIIRAHLHYPNLDNKKDKGKLTEWLYQPEFMVDPGHRKNQPQSISTS